MSGAASAGTGVRSPKHLVLDIGNVICEWNPDALIASAFDDPGQRAAARLATIGDPDWLALDRGTLDPDDAAARAIARSGLDPARVRAVYDNLDESLVPIEDVHLAMHEVHAMGVPIYILSNMHASSWSWLQRTYDVFALCAGHGISSEAKLVKPERAFYDHLTTRFGLEPADCVFVDDMAENVAAAIEAGWQAERLVDRKQGGALVRELAGRIVDGRSIGAAAGPVGSG